MQIIIDIPKEKYDLCKKWKPSERNELQEAVANGIPLPKGHGRLKDADRLITELKEHHDFFVNAYGGYKNMQIKDKARVDEIETHIGMIFNAPTIIEADKAEQGQKARNDNEYSS